MVPLPANARDLLSRRTIQKVLMKVAFIHNEKKLGTGAHYINDLMSLKLREANVETKNFYPEMSLDTPTRLSGIKNILFFHSLLEKKRQISKFDMIQGTTYTPLPFLEEKIPVVTHFGSTTQGFLSRVPLATRIEEDGPRQVWYRLKKEGAIRELNIRTRKPLRDIAEIETFVASRAEAVIATSENVRAELTASGVSPDKIHLIHNAIEDYWFEGRPGAFVENPSLVFLGRLGSDAFTLKLKGCDRLVDIYEKFPEAPKVTICMTTNSKLVDWMTRRLPNHLIHVNAKKDEIPNLLRSLRGSIVFIPSRYEGFSLSLIEAMSQGLVPVVYSVGVAPEAIRNGENGFVVSSQGEAEEKIRALMGDRSARERMSDEARKTARCFRSKVIARKLLRLYESVTAKQAPRA